ncbi:MAG: hypothetical protein JRD94_03725 [Deltaproteobacteria bacterium]|nr:hypothetical protein [Deltaproteobacteria bacterium]
MKPFTGVTLCVAFGLLVLGPPEAGARSCYSIWAEADKMGSHYRHIVYVENDCDYWLQCSVWTDVDPHGNDRARGDQREFAV